MSQEHTQPDLSHDAEATSQQSTDRAAAAKPAASKNDEALFREMQMMQLVDDGG